MSTPAPAPDRPAGPLHGATRLVGVRPAGEVIDAVSPASFLHAGPPIALDDLTHPMRAALAGALQLEGIASSPREASGLVGEGAVALRPAHEVAAVGAMAGVVSPSMPVVVVESEDGRRAFSPLNEGLGRALRFGAADADVLDNLRWMGDVLAPALDRALASTGPVVLTDIVTSGLHRGDECHNRNVASTSALLLKLAPAVVRTTPPDVAATVLERAAANPHFFLPFSMASAKALADGARGQAGSPLVVAMASNGRNFGIQVAGTGGRWFQAPAPVGTPRLFAGFELEDALPAMGDSFITEVAGLGAFALTAAPAIRAFVGGDTGLPARIVAEMREITVDRSERFVDPHTEWGYPLGIDVRAVAATGIAPVVNNGLAHRRGGVGQVGAGITRMPLEPFVAASEALAET